MAIENSRPRLVDEHETSRDGRKAHPRSTAPYGLEEHLNEEQSRRETIEKESENFDEFRIEPLNLENDCARIRASFNAYSIDLVIRRNDGAEIETREAETALNAMIPRLQK